MRRLGAIVPFIVASACATATRPPVAAVVEVAAHAETDPSELEAEADVEAATRAPRAAGAEPAVGMVRTREPVAGLRCVDGGGRIVTDATRCSLAVSAGVTDFAVFDDDGPEAQRAVLEALAHRAPELERCYLAAWSRDADVPWVVVPVTMQLDTFGAPAAELTIDAASASPTEERFVRCVRTRLATFSLPARPAPARLVFAVVFDPYRLAYPHPP